MKFQPEAASIACCLVLFLLQGTTCFAKNSTRVSFNPSTFKFTEGDSQLVRIRIDSTDANNLLSLRLNVKSADENVLTVTQSLNQFRDRSSIGNFSITLTANKIGRTLLAWRLYQMPANKTIDSGAFNVSVGRVNNKFQDIFLIVAAIFVTATTFFIGCLIDMDTVKAVFKEPITLAIGFAGQFVLMPVASFLSALAFFSGHLPFSIGLLAIGCCPSGLASNLYTFLFTGDVQLSLIVTVMSTFAAVVAMPLWMLIFGHISLGQTDTVGISFVNLVTLLLFLTFALTTGVAFRKISPSIGSFVERSIKTLVVLAIFTFAVGAICLLIDVVTHFTPKVVLAVLVISLTGVIFGSIVASVSKLPREKLLALYMETSLPNSVVAFVLLQTLLKHPDSDLAIVPVVGHIFISFTALAIAFGIHYVRRRTLKPNSRVELVDTSKDTKEEQKDIRENEDDIEFGIPTENN